MKFYILLLLAATISAKSINAGGRIIGGEAAYAGQFIFAAAIRVHTASSTFFCGGALIGNEWVLTAAQCVDGAITFTINLGSNNLEGDDENRVIAASSEYHIHPDYNPNTLENDIGLIKLRLPVTYTAYIYKIFLAYGNLSDYTNLVAIGWGQTTDSQAGLSNSLNFVNLAAVSNLECRAVYGNQINDNMVCVAGQYNEGICLGDSGGPLIHYDPATTLIRHVGIASFISANGCESVDPSGYTRTFSYRSWITEVSGILT